MSRYYIKAKRERKNRKIIRFVGLLMITAGMLTMSFVIFPLVSWYAYLMPFSDIELVTPIPESERNKHLMDNFFASSVTTIFDQTNYNDAKNWFSSYTLSIPKLGITKAFVSTVDTRLSDHLVHYPGTALPPNLGSAVIFGHSTLPQFFNQKNYKTIFANLYKLKKGDTIVVSVDNIVYTYIVDRIAITGPENKTVFTQRQNGKFLKLVTCTPPGTKWKRLVVQSRLQAI